MNFSEQDYLRYIEAFNARDYEGLETFFSDDFALENAGFKVQGKSAFRDFYAFFHHHIKETVIFKGFYPGKDGFVANVVIRFEGLVDLTPDVLEAEGYPLMTPVNKGQMAEVEFLILYSLNEAGLIAYIKGAVWIPEIAKT